jgi:hypothetical protein
MDLEKALRIVDFNNEKFRVDKQGGKHPEILGGDFLKVGFKLVYPVGFKNKKIRRYSVYPHELQRSLYKVISDDKENVLCGKAIEDLTRVLLYFFSPDVSHKVIKLLVEENSKYLLGALRSFEAYYHRVNNNSGSTFPLEIDVHATKVFNDLNLLVLKNSVFQQWHFEISKEKMNSSIDRLILVYGAPAKLIKVIKQLEFTLVHSGFIENEMAGSRCKMIYNCIRQNSSRKKLKVK